MTFGEYSHWYDLTNSAKDYVAESSYITRLIRSRLPYAKELLELGCGTGNHARHLTNEGFSITGIERSPGMAKAARGKEITGFNVIEGDIRYDIPKQTFDAVISLFHVINYLTDTDDLLRVFDAIHQALRPGGIFLFDSWFSPAVYTEPPSSRHRVFENDEVRIARQSKPEHDPVANIVDVQFDIRVTDKRSGTVQEFTEQHRMRHFGLPEIDLLARQTGFTLSHVEEFLTGKPPGTDTWGICFILKRS